MGQSSRHVDRARQRNAGGGLSPGIGGVYESSPWVAEMVLQRRPFSTPDDLIRSMRQVVADAPVERQLALIKAHPDLGGKLARCGELTPDSTKEQSRLGLDRLGEEEYEKFDSMNRGLP